MKSIDPATGRVIASFEEIGDDDLEIRLALSRRAFESWRTTGFDLRASLMLRAAEFLESAKRDLGRLMTLDVGEPLGGAIAEAEKCAWVCRYYAENAASQLADEEVATPAKRSRSASRPRGPGRARLP